MIIKGKLQRKQLAIKLILLFLVLLIVMIIIGLAGELINRHKVSDKIGDLERQISETQGENLEIGTLISSWEGGSQLEKEARSKLGLKKAGETIVLIDRESSGTPTAMPTAIDPDILNPANEIPKNDSGNPSKWWQYFFN